MAASGLALGWMAWALWQDDQHRAAKMHVAFAVLRQGPVDVTVTACNGSERAEWRRLVQPGELLRLSIWAMLYYSLFQELHDLPCSFFGRVKDNAAYEVQYGLRQGAGSLRANKTLPVTQETGEPTMPEDQVHYVNGDHGLRSLTAGMGARLAAIVDLSDDPIIGKDLNGVVFAWNRAAERLFGYTASEVIGQPLTLIFPPDRLEEEGFILGQIARGKRVEHYETTRRCKDGRNIRIAATISPIKDVRGRVIGASTIVRDLTEHDAHEKAHQ